MYFPCIRTILALNQRRFLIARWERLIILLLTLRTKPLSTWPVIKMSKSSIYRTFLWKRNPFFTLWTRLPTFRGKMGKSMCSLSLARWLSKKGKLKRKNKNRLYLNSCILFLGWLWVLLPIWSCWRGFRVSRIRNLTMSFCISLKIPIFARYSNKFACDWIRSWNPSTNPLLWKTL